MGFFSSLRRRAKLSEAFRFGREFYGINLEQVNAPFRPAILQMMEAYDDPIPQATFFMLVPAYLGALEPLKALELYDGICSLRLRGLVHEDIFDNFMREFQAIDPNDPTKWIRDSLEEADNHK